MQSGWKPALNREKTNTTKMREPTFMGASLDITASYAQPTACLCLLCEVVTSDFAYGT